MSHLSIFKKKIFFVKSRLFSNFVLASGFSVKIEKIADATPKFTQNRGKNPKTIG
jgi:hypothetical protein